MTAGAISAPALLFCRWLDVTGWMRLGRCGCMDVVDCDVIDVGIWMDDGWMDVWVDGWMGGWMVWMD